jgi:hypothetical protein
MVKKLKNGDNIVVFFFITGIFKDQNKQINRVIHNANIFLPINLREPLMPKNMHYFFELDESYFDCAGDKEF